MAAGIKLRPTLPAFAHHIATCISVALYIHEKQKSHTPIASVTRKNDTLRWDPLSRVSANIPRQNTPNAVTSVWTARELNMYPVVSKSCDVMSPFILTYSQLHIAAQEDFLAATFRFSFLTPSMSLWIFEQAEVSSLYM